MIYHITSRSAGSAGLATVVNIVPKASERRIHPLLDRHPGSAGGRKILSGQRDLLLLMIDPALLASDLKWEPPSGGIPPPAFLKGSFSPIFMARSI